MKRNDVRKECGSVEVEATIILPIAILSVILLLYVSLFMFQRANLQAGLETTLIYYKNSLTDTYVIRNNELSYSVGETTKAAAGNSYSATSPLSPYRGMFGDGQNIKDEEAFEKYFESVAGNMLFDDNLELKIDYHNRVIFKEIEVSATQTVEAPIDFSFIGVGNTYEISATARVNVIDHEDAIRNVDYAIDIVEDTKLGDLAKNFKAKFDELYGKMKETLKVE